MSVCVCVRAVKMLLGFSWVKCPQAENTLICQQWSGRREKGSFSIVKNVGQDDFFYAAMPSGAVPRENIDTPFAGLKWLCVLPMEQEEEKEEKYTCKQNKKILLQVEMEKQASKWHFSLILPTSETLEDSCSTVFFIFLYFLTQFGIRKM